MMDLLGLWRYWIDKDYRLQPKNALSMFGTGIEAVNDNDTRYICCPFCKSNYVSFAPPEIIYADQSDIVRGQVIAIPFYCELDEHHTGKLCFGTHKGNVLYWFTTDWVDYHQYINSEIWKAKSKAAKERAGYCCEICKQPGNDQTLKGHHKTYERLGFENSDDILVVCDSCHKDIHKKGKTNDGQNNRG